MWALIVLFYSNGGYGGHLASTSVDGFLSREACVRAAAWVTKSQTRDRVIVHTTCVEKNP